MNNPLALPRTGFSRDGTTPAAVPTSAPASEDVPGWQGSERTVLGLVELLLKDAARVDRLNRDPDRQREMFPRFLLIAEASYLLFGFVLALAFTFVPADAYPHHLPVALPPVHWGDGTALGLPLAYAVGIVLSAGVCLPSFYFYSLLAGVRMSWLQIVSVLGKGTAANAVLLLGILPIYVAVVLGLTICEAPVELLRWSLLLGLLLPVVSGLWGLHAIYLGVMDLAEGLPSLQYQRRCFLRRLVVGWTVVYAAVVPVLVYRLWETFAAGIRFDSGW